MSRLTAEKVCIVQSPSSMPPKRDEGMSAVRCACVPCAYHSLCVESIRIAELAGIVILNEGESSKTSKTFPMTTKGKLLNRVVRAKGTHYSVPKGRVLRVITFRQSVVDVVSLH